MSTDIGLDLIWDTNDEKLDFLNLDFNSSGDLGGCDGGDEKLPDSGIPIRSEKPFAAELMPPIGENKSSENEGKKKGKKCVRFELGVGDGEGSESPEKGNKVHTWTERERRKKMRTMFSNLHAMLPHLPAKVDKFTIVDEAVNQIKSLEATLHELEKQKHRVAVPATTYDSSKMFVQPQVNPDTREVFVANQVSTNSNIAAFNPTNSSTPSHFSPSSQPPISKSLMLNVSGLDAQICVCSNKKPGLFIGICSVLEKYKLELVSAQVSSDDSKSMYMIHTHACCSELLETFPVEEIYTQAIREITFFINLR